MNKSTLSITQHGSVRQILLDRPEALNALNGQMTDDLTDAFLAQQDDQVKVVLLSGAGRAFWRVLISWKWAQAERRRDTPFKT